MRNQIPYCALALFLALGATGAGAVPGVQQLHLGDAAPDFSLPGIDGRTRTLADYRDAKVLVVAFISNHCPDSQAAKGRLKQFVADLSPRGVTLVAINPNNPEGLREEELGFSKYNDGPAEIKLHAQEQGFNFPYLYDGETQATAKVYGCFATPHLFVFDADRKLRYQGYLDDSRFADPATVKKPAAQIAVEALLAGQPVTVPETKPHGCSTKWLEKNHAALPDRLKPSLKAEGRQSSSYVYNSASQDELIAALDRTWPGAMPHSVLVAPDGSILWRHTGQVDGEELRAQVLEILGRYYLPE